MLIKQQYKLVLLDSVEQILLDELGGDSWRPVMQLTDGRLIFTRPDPKQVAEIEESQRQLTQNAPRIVPPDLMRSVKIA